MRKFAQKGVKFQFALQKQALGRLGSSFAALV
jgi:hypothetical protein